MVLTGTIGLAQRQVAGNCKSGNETSRFFIRCDIINCQEWLSYKKL